MQPMYASPTQSPQAPRTLPLRDILLPEYGPPLEYGRVSVNERQMFHDWWDIQDYDARISWVVRYIQAWRRIGSFVPVLPPGCERYTTMEWARDYLFDYPELRRISDLAMDMANNQNYPQNLLGRFEAIADVPPTLGHSQSHRQTGLPVLQMGPSSTTHQMSQDPGTLTSRVIQASAALDPVTETKTSCEFTFQPGREIKTQF